MKTKKCWRNIFWRTAFVKSRAQELSRAALTRLVFNRKKRGRGRPRQCRHEGSSFWCSVASPWAKSTCMLWCARAIGPLAAEGCGTSCVQLLLADFILADLWTIRQYKFSANISSYTVWRCSSVWVEHLQETERVLIIHAQDGKTALFFASLTGHKEVLQFLLQKHADVSISKTVYKNTV